MWCYVLYIYLAGFFVRWVYLVWNFAIPVKERTLCDWFLAAGFGAAVAAFWWLHLARAILRG